MRSKTETLIFAALLFVFSFAAFISDAAYTPLTNVQITGEYTITSTPKPDTEFRGKLELVGGTSPRAVISAKWESKVGSSGSWEASSPPPYFNEYTLKTTAYGLGQIHLSLDGARLRHRHAQCRHVQ